MNQEENKLSIYDAVRSVPAEAQRAITGGRLKGKTDINPMWRIRVLTEVFGPCGTGWKYEITNKWLEPCPGSNEVAAFVDINLYFYDTASGSWSEPIPGTGGSMFCAQEREGLRCNDECFKMALTDAISVAAKALGVGADIYWKDGATKYSANTGAAAPAGRNTAPKQRCVCRQCGKPIKGAVRNGRQHTPEEMAKATGGLCVYCWRQRKGSQNDTQQKG